MVDTYTAHTFNVRLLKYNTPERGVFLLLKEGGSARVSSLNPIQPMDVLKGKVNSVRGDGRLSPIRPDGEPADHFVSDPNDPVPTRGGNTLIIAMGVQDQRPVEEHQDVLVYTTEPVSAPLEVTGPVVVKLFAATSAPDRSWAKVPVKGGERTGDATGISNQVVKMITTPQQKDSRMEKKIAPSERKAVAATDCQPLSTGFSRSLLRSAGRCRGQSQAPL